MAMRTGLSARWDPSRTGQTAPINLMGGRAMGGSFGLGGAGTAAAGAAAGRPKQATTLSKMLAEYRSQQKAAREANERRYQEILGGYKTRYQEAMTGLEGLGAQEGADIRQAYAGRESQAMQDLVSRGLSGTSIAPTTRMGIERGKTAELGRLQERLRRERLGYQTGLSEDLLKFQERREDIAPNLEFMARLAEKIGAGGMEDKAEMGAAAGAGGLQRGLYMGGGGGGLSIGGLQQAPQQMGLPAKETFGKQNLANMAAHLKRVKKAKEIREERTRRRQEERAAQGALSYKHRQRAAADTRIDPEA